MKTQLYIVSLVLVSVAACNYSTECWPRGQGDSEGAGSGTVDSTGPGNPGEGPTGQAQEPLSGDQCNDPESPPPDNGTTELSEFACPKITWGMACQGLCEGQGVDCKLPVRPHPKKSDGGLGLLWRCCGCQGKQKCIYFYPNTGDSCTFDAPLFLNLYTTCGYPGGKQ